MQFPLASDSTWGTAFEGVERRHLGSHHSLSLPPAEQIPAVEQHYKGDELSIAFRKNTLEGRNAPEAELVDSVSPNVHGKPLNLDRQN